MTNKIALTASMRSNLLSLQNTQKLFNSTQDHLSTGYKVNSAMDNPSSYFTAQALNSRANDLSTLLDSIGQSISTLEVADQGITTLQSYVEQAKSVANSARDTSNVASKATTNNVKFDPDNARTDLVTDYVNLTAGPAPKVVAGTKTVSGSSTMGDLGLNAGQDLQITVGDTTKTYTMGTEISAATKVEELLATVESDFGSNVKAEIVDGNIKITALDGSDVKIEGTIDSETHKTQVYTFAAGDDVSGYTATASLTLGNNSDTLDDIDLSGVVTAAGTHSASLTAEELEAVASAYAAAINAAAEAGGIDVVATADGANVKIIDNTRGNTTHSPVMDEKPAANDDTGTETVEYPGTSAAAKLGFGDSKEGVSKPNNSFSVRLGDATKMTGTANLRADKTLEEMGMIDGQSIDIIVGDKVHTYTVGKEIDKTATMQEFMDDMVYDIGRTKIKAELVDGNLTISTLDNSSLSIRSTNQVEVREAENISATAIDTFLAGGADRSLTSVTFTPDGGSAINVDLTGVTTAEGVVDAINSNASAKAAGILAKMNEQGNIAIFDKDGDHAAPASVSIATATGGSASASIGSSAGYASYELKGTSFNELVGFTPAQTVEVSDDMTVEKFRQAINNLDGVSADFDTKGHLVISGEQGDDLVMVNDKNSNVLKNLFGDDVVTATNGSNERAKYAQQFDNILTQIDELVQDTSYKGINLLNGDSLLVNFNESRTSSLNIKGVTFDSVGLGFTRSANEWISNDDIDNALNQISKATSLLRAQASEFGQNLSTVQIREDFTQNMINNLQSGADKLTLADMNEEAANMLALQTRQQLATNSLSMANQSAQSVLRLF